MGQTNNYGNWQFDANASGAKNSINSDNLDIGDHEDGVDIRVSMFFDGTMNNRFNTEAREEYDKKTHGEAYKKDRAAVYEKRLEEGKSGDDEEDSYANDYSNVARLFKNYLADTSDSNKKNGAVYIEGIGTYKDEDDSSFWGGGFGTGKAGIPTRVKEGCEQMAKMISELVEHDKIAKLTIDVFGFSRGAAAARHFISEIIKKKVEAHTDTISIPLEEGGGIKKYKSRKDPLMAIWDFI